MGTANVDAGGAGAAVADNDGALKDVGTPNVAKGTANARGALD